MRPKIGNEVPVEDGEWVDGWWMGGNLLEDSQNSDWVAELRADLTPKSEEEGVKIDLADRFHL